MVENPFTERGRITEPQRFAGRWSELSLVFDAIQAGRPVLVSGSPGIGKSSLISHVADAAAVNLERDDLRAFYLDLAGATAAADVYGTVVRALRGRGDTLASLEVALVADSAPTLLALDNVGAALAAGWGEGLLESLARMVRSGGLILVAALDGPPPLLSERFVHIRLGAFAPSEIGLLAETYLDGTGIQFTPADLRAVIHLSVAHPAYVQRAAFHLFRSKQEPGYDWRAAYLQEARERPVPGAPLPAAVFEGEAAGPEHSRYDGGDGEEGAPGRSLAQLPTVPAAMLMLLPLLLAALIFLLSGSALLALGTAVVGVAAIALLVRRRAP